MRHPQGQENKALPAIKAIRETASGLAHHMPLINAEGNILPRVSSPPSLYYQIETSFSAEGGEGQEVEDSLSRRTGGSG